MKPLIAKIVLSIVLAGFAVAGLAAPINVERWGVFEISLPGPTNGNPFLEVKLSARFTQGDAAIAADGFYDGHGIYCVRFMPEKLGEWKYETASSAAELNGQTGAFTVTDRKSTRLNSSHAN